MSDPLTLEAMRRKAVDDLYAVFASDVVLEAEVEAILARLATLDAERAQPAIDVERLTEALYRIHSWPVFTAKREAEDIAREYAAITERSRP